MGDKTSIALMTNVLTESHVASVDIWDHALDPKFCNCVLKTKQLKIVGANKISKVRMEKNQKYCTSDIIKVSHLLPKKGSIKQE